MPTIRLTDNLGLDLDIKPNPVSAIAKYLRNPGLNLAPAVELARFIDTPLDEVAFQRFSTGLSFSQDAEVGAGETELKIGAGLNGNLAIYQKGSTISPEHYRAPIRVGDEQVCLALGVKATVSAALSSEVNNLSFGFKSGSEVSLYNFKLFSAKPAAPTLKEALGQTIAGFSIPGDVEDLAAMSPGTVSSVNGSGKLKFSGGAELAQSTSLLASPDLPGGLGPVKVKAGGSLAVNASFQVSGEYEIRVRKLDQNRVEIGYYNKLGSEFDVSASASYGVSATLGQIDVIPTVLGLISSDPKADEEALAAAGLAPDRISDIEDAIKAGIDRSLAAAAGYEFNALDSNQAAFLYEVRLDQLTAEGRQALHSALDGDLTPLTRRENALAGQGITTLRTILTNIRNRTHTFKVNLLGIYNAISITELLRTGEVLFDPERGGLVITDRATAKRIRAAMVNFAADPEKLRRVLAETFLITAAYRASRPGEAPELSSTHSFFEYTASTSRQRLLAHQRAMEAVGLGRGASPPPTEEFGHCSFLLDAAYNNDVCVRLFLDPAGNPRPEDEYRSIGRRALAALIDPSTENITRYRLVPLMDDALWSAMCKAGSAPAIRAILPPALKDDDVKPQVIASDYILIAWWAETMHSTAEILAKVREYQQAHPSLDPENNDFKKLRKRLSDHLADVARKTKEHFSDPWGLVAMDMASGRRAEMTAKLTSPRLSLAQQRPRAIPAGGGGTA